jgi:uncharacterized protein YecA (UPF0149 family)
LIKRQQLMVKSGIRQHGLVQGSPPAAEVGEMTKIGRNDLCPCGSGKNTSAAAWLRTRLLHAP